ncbi:RnfABCDGE type electron transport complex subunit D [Corallococcus sp. M34]|uniref:RnfABCDGE type electron transport complex subunit D n=1 Tax=Citreicoccus inhibens TaxID=2849499 RepID=UPI001C2467EC|nr:RnfABCDGE type electron transport complex subunit D [Citreicoccus inhibens]MBU8900207.1 RnfABCDGE type electron transport complex subunit D [Citreicoccus inhibens]
MKTWTGSLRIAGLRRFAVAITVLNLLGHSVLGFEMAWAHPLVALGTAYAMELLLEWLEARAQGRAPRFMGGVGSFVDFLLPAHITGLAVAMLLYANARLAPVAFASAVAIASKALFRAPVEGTWRHFLNPSNFGISVTLLAFPSVGIAPPYQFTENLYGVGDWVLPAIIVCTGTFLNARFTQRLPLILGWVGGFALQALLRAWLMGGAVMPPLMPMTGVAFVLYTFYMVTDPGTTPRQPVAQVMFGASVAAAYCLLVGRHIVFDLFFSLTVVCVARGALLYARALLPRRDAPPTVLATSAGGEPRS